jgi:predicted dehydrogenase
VTADLSSSSSELAALRLAVVGTGALGRHHARILAQLPGVSLAAVADVNPRSAEEIGQKHQAPWTTDFRELIGSVDAVIVAVPTTAHYEVASEFLAAGADVFIEKPIALNVEDGARLVDLAAEQNAILQVGHVERFNPALVAARGRLGAPKYIRAERYSPYAFRSTDIGVVHDLMIHDLDIVLSLCGAQVERVEALGISILGEHEDCVQARLTFAGGCIADLTANRVSPVVQRTMQIWSSEGCANLDFAARQSLVYRPSAALRYGASPLERARRPGADIEALKAEVFSKYIEIENPASAASDPLTEELLDFTRSIRARTQPIVDGAAALAAMQIAQRILEQVAQHRWESGADSPAGPFAPAFAARRLAG